VSLTLWKPLQRLVEIPFEGGGRTATLLFVRSLKTLYHVRWNGGERGEERKDREKKKG